MLLVARELASTDPETCWAGTLSVTRSAKLVSVRLKAVVCELAMLPEMFCNANDCACRPVTAEINASKTPMPILHPGRGRRSFTAGGSHAHGGRANPVP